MKKYPRLQLTENYTLSEDDFQESNEFADLLKHLTDIPNSEPTHKIAISNVGINSQQLMVFVEDLEKRNNYVPVLCDINLGVSLVNNRGIHSSRSIEVVEELSTKKYKHLDDFTAEMARRVKEKQNSEVGIAEVVGTYIYKRPTIKTKKESFDRFYLINKASATNDNIDVKIGLKAYNITACPCTKAYTKYSVIPKLKAMGLSLKQINEILNTTISGTHTQRGTITVIVDKESSHITHKDLYAILDKSVHLTYELLKRPDEHELVTRAIQRPQFTEDAVREVAFNTYQDLKDKLSSNASIYAESLLHDSIHTHDIRSIIDSTFGKIKRDLSK